MTDHCPHREFAIEVVRKLHAAGHTALWAGGCVRDLLTGREPQDYDVATDAVPDQVRALFGKRRTLAVGASFGVIIVLGPKHNGETICVEVATFRTESGYSDGRRPDQVAFSTPEEDAWRRDFTINGMFYDPLQEEVRDYVGGQQDLRDGIVRAIGTPAERMREDKLRMLRAVRFTATFDFELDTATADAVRAMADQLSIVSAERVAQELRKMLVSPHRRRAVRLMQSINLLGVVFPEFAEPAETEETAAWQHTLDTLDALESPSFELALATLLPGFVPQGRQFDDDGAKICRRLKLSNHETERITWLVQQRDTMRSAPEMPLCRLKGLLAHPGAEELLKFTAADLTARGSDMSPVEFVRTYLERTPPERIDPSPLISGADLIELGLSPGPRFKELLTMVRDAQLNEEITTADEARRWLGDQMAR